MATFNLTGAGTYTLAASIGSTDTSIVLTSFAEPVSGTLYTMANINTDIVYATIGPGTSTSEFISFSGITQNGDGTATLTGVVRGLARKSPFTTSSTYKQPHSGQSTFILSNPPQVYNKFVSLVNAETISGIKTFATGATPLVTDAPTTNLMVANKLYVDTSVTAGAPDASTTTKGIGKLSVAPVAANNPIFVGDNDSRMLPTTGTSGGIIGFTSTTVRASSALLTNHAIVVGGGAGATPTPLASLGTTTTLLHGNASGDPTFGQIVNADITNATIDLTAKVTGVLPIANGGTGSSTLPFAGLFKNGTADKDATEASTTQNIAHGLGVIPKKIRITALIYDNTNNYPRAETAYNGTTQSSISFYGTASNWAGATTFTLCSGATSANTQTGVVTFDATNIIIAWTKTNSPTGNFHLLWEAMA